MGLEARQHLAHDEPVRPLVLGTDSDAQNEALGGSPLWRVGYLLALIALAAIAALLHGSDGARRALLQRAFAGAAVLAVVLLLVAALTGPDYQLMPKT